MHDFQPRKGFTLIELLVVIAIIAILAAILFPVFARARENARRASCMSNLKQITLGMMQYTQDFDERLPDYKGGATPFYHEQLQPYVKSYQIFRCPSGRSLTGATQASLQYPTYGFNGTATWGLYRTDGWPLAAIEEPAITWMLAETRYSVARWESDGWGRANTRLGALPADAKPEDADTFLKDIHLDGSNIGFADGHVKWVKNGQGGVGYRWRTH